MQYAKETGPGTSHTKGTPVVEETNGMTTTQGSARDVGIQYHTAKANNAHSLD